MKRFLTWVAALLVLVLALGGVWLQRLRSGQELVEGELAVPGLEGPVEVLFDSLGVPHVWADSEADVLFAQGYLHARDRLWQMEMFRRVAEGRLSELFGEATLSADRFLRTLGLSRVTERHLETLDRQIRERLEAYVRGVNAALDGWFGPMPPELVLLRAGPEGWTVRHSLAIERIMAWDLTNYGSGLTLARVRDERGIEAFETVRPDYPEWGVTIVEGWPSPEGEGLPAESAGVAAGAAAGHPVASRLLREAMPPPLAEGFLARVSTVRASNSWVVGGSRSASGKPLLSNDMHLGLDAPTIWYLMGLHAPGLDVVGMTLPGTPGVVAGHSAAVAWGFTNAGLDDGDLFIERLDPADSSRYLAPEGSLPFTVRTEEIRVRGRDQPVTFQVRETRHGPVMTPVESRANGQLLAYRWVGHDPSGTARALWDFGAARSVGELIETLRHFDNPHQNVVFADTAGRFGYWMAGRVPVRRSGGPALTPVPGWTGEHDWVSVLPFEEHPHVLDPERGYVVTANNRQSRDSISLLVSDRDWAQPYRAQKITELVEAEDAHDAESMHRIQLHAGSAFIDRYRASAERAYREAGLEDVAARLASWDGVADLESTEATAFFSWVEALQAALRGDLYGEEGGYFPMRAVATAMDGSWDEVGPLALEAAREAAPYADEPWGEVHQLTMDHPLGRIPILGALVGFGVGPLPRAGGIYSPNVASYSGGRPPFRVGAGPSQRHVVDMADPDGSGGFILPGGQSGWPRAKHSWDQLQRWRGGRLWLLPLSRERVEERTVRRATLLPTGP